MPFSHLNPEYLEHINKRLQIAHENGAGKLNPGMTREQHDAILYGDYYNGLDMPLLSVAKVRAKKLNRLLKPVNSGFFMPNNSRFKSKDYNRKTIMESPIATRWERGTDNTPPPVQTD